MKPLEKRKIAIVGSGISGLGAAYALRDTADIHVFEKRSRPGGHANTVSIDYDGTEIAVDTGFIVFNEMTYPNFCPLLDKLGVASHESDMSFSFSVTGGVEWSSNSHGLFAQKRNILSFRHLKMLKDILRFNDLAQAELAAGRIGSQSLREWLDRHGFDRTFRHRYILPMGAAIWSSDDASMAEVSAQSFIRFFRNHRLLHAKRPKWRTVTGGSRTYVKAIVDRVGSDRFTYNADIVGVEHRNTGARLHFGNGTFSDFDEVILAVHADTALKLLRNPGERETRLLQAFPYSRNRVWLHRDETLMPTRKRAWAAWNAIAGDEASPAAVTYWMNVLQGIDRKRPLFVTLNAQRKPDDALLFAEYSYNHPQFSPRSDAAQSEFADIQGEGHIWYAGAWLGYGFHEDGLRTGLQVARALGGNPGFAIGDGDTPYGLPFGNGDKTTDSYEAISV